MRRYAWLFGVLLMGAAMGQEEVVPLRVGQALWRAEVTPRTITTPDGERQIRADAFAFTLAEPTDIRLTLRSYGAVVATLNQVVGEGAAEERTELATVDAAQSYERTLGAGDYLIVVIGAPISSAGYLLALAEPAEFDARLERGVLAQPGRDEVVASWLLPFVPTAIALSPSGHWAAAHDGQQAWLFDLDAGAAWRLAAEPGPVRRVLFSPGEWVVTVASSGGARLYSLPDLVPLMTMRPTDRATGEPLELADVAFWNPELGLTLLPTEGNASFVDPNPEPALEVVASAGVALDSAPESGWIALRRGPNEFSIIDIDSQQAFGEITFGRAPEHFSVSPTEPAMLVTGPGLSQIWRAAPGTEGWQVPPLRVGGWSYDGRLYAADDEGVAQFLLNNPIRLRPSLDVELLAVNSGSLLRIMAVRADGQAVVWELDDGPADGAESPLARARSAYAAGLAAFNRGDWADAHVQFVIVRDLIERMPPGLDPELPLVEAMAWLRASQASYMLRDWDGSRAEAERLIELAAALPEGEERTFYRAMGLYRQADALWEAGDQAAARPIYQRALDAGLTGAAAADAQQKVAP